MREFVGQVSLRACKSTAEGLMMPSQTPSLFTKTHTGVFTIAGFLCHAGGQKTSCQNATRDRQKSFVCT